MSLKDNPIWKVWETSDGVRKAEFVSALALNYNALLCNALQGVNKCCKAKRDTLSNKEGLCEN